MNSVDVVGIVSMADDKPYVQFTVVDAEGERVARWQLSPDSAREFAHTVHEASTNAVYEASIIDWSKSVNTDNPDIGVHLVNMIRHFRADKWGQPTIPDSPADEDSDG